MLRRVVLATLLAATMSAGVAVRAGAAEPTIPLQPAPSAFPAVSAPTIVADSTSCASTCQAEHDKCRVETKGGPVCDAKRQRCLQACLVKKGR
jgi:hypothetical protein